MKRRCAVCGVSAIALFLVIAPRHGATEKKIPFYPPIDVDNIALPAEIPYLASPILDSLQLWVDGFGNATQNVTQIEGRTHFGRLEEEVADKLKGVHDYYNSTRAIRLIGDDGPLPGNQFHTPFVVENPKTNKLDTENVYMMRLGKLLDLDGRAIRGPGHIRKKVIDFGCGLGRFAAEIANTSCCEVTGVNIAEGQVQVANRQAHLNVSSPRDKMHLNFTAYDGRRLPFKDGEIDLIFFQESFFHVPNKCEILGEMGRVLKHGGTVVGLDWFSAHGLTEHEYNYWIGAINIGWEATIGSPEEIAYCMRQAGMWGIEISDIEHLTNVMDKPRHHFMPMAQDLKEKYGTYTGQLSVNSFRDSERHTYALEAMAFGVANGFYTESIVIGTKGQMPTPKLVVARGTTMSGHMVEYELPIPENERLTSFEQLEKDMVQMSCGGFNAAAIQVQWGDTCAACLVKCAHDKNCDLPPPVAGKCAVYNMLKTCARCKNSCTAHVREEL